jgi:hypothetical protein
VSDCRSDELAALRLGLNAGEQRHKPTQTNVRCDRGILTGPQSIAPPPRFSSLKIGA